MTCRPRPSAKALKAAADWQAPAGPRIEWTPSEAAEINEFGDDLLRLRIADDGTVGRHLPHCGMHVRIVDDRFQPLRAKPLASEEDAKTLLARVRALS
mgnify:CR=1 FL=1